MIQAIDSAQEITAAATRLRDVVRNEELAPQTLLEVFENWSAALSASELQDISGLAFLRLWLRRGTLEPILLRELGPNALTAGWCEDGRARLRAFPLGIVGHWPAANIEIQPALSLTCALLAGNCCLVRVPTSLVEVTRRITEKLHDVDPSGIVTRRFFMASFDHSRIDLHEAMAHESDGAMIWGGAEAVSQIRRLPFPHWSRLLVFGPRVLALLGR